MPLKVGIIGAGIGGLSAAIGLRRSGAEVEIFERSTFKYEIGAAITITPNGSRILDSWGFDDVKAGVVEAKSLRMVHAHTLDTAFVEDLKDLPREFGAKMGFYHRVDLHSTLKEMAEGCNNGQPGTPAVIKLGNAVMDVDCEGGIITLADGSRVIKDVVVIADGTRSPFTAKVTGRAEPIREMGWSVYRCLIPMSSILADPATRPLFEGQPPGYWTPFYLPRAFYLVAYACRGGRTLNIALRHTTTPEPRDERGKDESWNSPARAEDVLALLREYHPALGQVVAKADEVKMYKLLRREPLERYARGRAVVIGDAAHTVLPTHAQGAVLAIEEAAALAQLLAGPAVAAEPDLVPARLELYSRLMKRHLHINQYLSETVPGTRDKYRQRAEELCGDGLFDHMALSFTAPVQKFFYSYDVRAEVAEAMREAGLL